MAVDPGSLFLRPNSNFLWPYLDVLHIPLNSIDAFLAARRYASAMAMCLG